MEKYKTSSTFSAYSIVEYLCYEKLLFFHENFPFLGLSLLWNVHAQPKIANLFLTLYYNIYGNFRIIHSSAECEKYKVGRWSSRKLKKKTCWDIVHGCTQHVPEEEWRKLQRQSSLWFITSFVLTVCRVGFAMDRM